MTRSVRHAYLVCGLAACSFETRLAVDDAAIDATDAAGDAVPDEMTAAPLCDPGDLDLRACFTFDATMQDGSSYGNDILPSVIPIYVPGRAGAGQALSTSNGTYTTPATTSLNITTFTLKMWIKPTAIPTGGARMGLLDSGSRYRVFLQSDGAIRCAVTNGADLTTATNVIVPNTWQRVACRYDGTTMTIHVNGTQVATSNQTSTVPSVTGGMVVGHNNPTGENFNGALDELQIWGALVAP